MKRSEVLRLLSWLCYILMMVVAFYSLGRYFSGLLWLLDERLVVVVVGLVLSFCLVTVLPLLIGLWLGKAANAAQRREEGKGAKA